MENTDIKKILTNWYEQKKENLEIRKIESSDKKSIIVTSFEIEQEAKKLFEDIKSVDPDVGIKNHFHALCCALKLKVGNFAYASFVDIKEDEPERARAIFYINQKNMLTDRPTASFFGEVIARESNIIYSRYRNIEKSQKEALNILKFQTEIDSAIINNVYLRKNYFAQNATDKFPSVKTYVIDRYPHEDSSGNHFIKQSRQEDYDFELKIKMNAIKDMLEAEVALIYLKEKKYVVVDYMPSEIDVENKNKLFETIKSRLKANARAQTNFFQQTKNSRFLIIEKADTAIYKTVVSIVLEKACMTSKEDRENIKQKRIQEILYRQKAIKDIESELTQKYIKRIESSVAQEERTCPEIRTEIEKAISNSVRNVVQDRLPNDEILLNVMWDPFYYNVFVFNGVENCQAFGYGSNIPEKTKKELVEMSKNISNEIDLEMISYGSELSKQIKRIINRIRILEEGPTQLILVERNTKTDKEKIKEEIESFFNDNSPIINVFTPKEALSQNLGSKQNTIDFIVADIRPTSIARAIYTIDKTIVPSAEIWEILKMIDRGGLENTTLREQSKYCAAITAIDTTVKNCSMLNGNDFGYLREEKDKHPISFIGDSILSGGFVSGLSVSLLPLRNMLVEIIESKNTETRSMLEYEGETMAFRINSDDFFSKEKILYRSKKQTNKNGYSEEVGKRKDGSMRAGSLSFNNIFEGPDTDANGSLNWQDYFVNTLNP